MSKQVMLHGSSYCESHIQHTKTLWIPISELQNVKFSGTLVTTKL